MNIQEFFKLGMMRDIPELLDMPEGKILNVGAGFKHISGAESIDYPEWDADCEKLPYGDDSISGIHCYSLLEHVEYPIRLLRDFQRILKVGGVVNIVVPYYNTFGNAKDLDHKHNFNEETWQCLFDNKYYDKNRIDWQFRVHAYFIMGVSFKNIVLFTQLQKMEYTYKFEDYLLG